MGKKILVLLFSIILCLAVLEVYGLIIEKKEALVQFGLLRYKNSMAKIVNHYDPYLGHKMLPGLNVLVEGHPDYTFTVTTNSLGFKDNIGFRNNNINNDVYAVAIGDSFTWGHGVENNQTWPKVLESFLGKEVVNMGLTYGTSPIQYYRILERYAVSLNPKVVLVGFFSYNDFVDSWYFRQWEQAKVNVSDVVYNNYISLPQDEVENFQNKPLNKKIRLFLKKHSAVFRMYRKFEKSFIKRKTLKIKLKQGWLPLPKNDFYFTQYDYNKSKDEFKYGLELSQEAVLDSQKLCVKKGIRFIVVLMPARSEVYFDYIIKNNKVIDREKAFSNYHKFKKFLELNGIEYIDLFPFLQEKARESEKLYFTDDGHWNVLGNYLVGQYINDYLKSTGK